MHVIGTVSTFHLDSRQPALTKEEREACIRNLKRSMPIKHAQVVCIEDYRWERRACVGVATTERVGALSENNYSDLKPEPHLRSLIQG